VKSDPAPLRTPFALVLGVTLVGFMAEYVLRPVIPLLIVDHGGGATTVGLITGVFALPSIGLRPAVGWLLDRWRRRRVLGFGALLASVSPVGLLPSSILALAATRFLQGTAWALFTVSTRTLMAQAAPVARRAEASAYFAAMPALALLIGPGVGVTLYLATGGLGPVALATALGVTSLLLVITLPPTLTDAVGGSTVSSPDRSIGRFIEPSVFPAMAMTAALMAADAIFTIFPPVFVAAVGEDPAALAIYYPAYGLASALSLFAIGRISDRLGRGRSIRVGGAIAIVGLSAAILGTDLLGFGIGAVIYAIGASFASPALAALSIDEAPAHRLGSAMATYSIGYQLAIGASGVVWGPVISVAGFDAALGGAVLFVLGSVAASYRYARDGRTA
jgi:MFS family permease